MKTKRVLLVALVILAFYLSVDARVMELLNRGVVAVRTGTNSVYVGWRMFGTDPSDIGFNVYRGGVKLNATPITASTNYTDATSANSTYTVRPVIGGVEGSDSEAASVWATQYKTINLNRPAGGTTPDGVAYTYSPNDCSVGDVDGDGEYEIIVKWDPSNSKDNSQSGYTGNVYLDCYKLSGAFMWRIDLGINIRAGAHYTQFMVYDLNSDGKSEIACKTAPGTRDATGAYLRTGPAVSDTDSADYRNTSGYILSGPEYMTVFNGQTGAEITTVNYVPARGTVSSWGDSYGNRVDRFLAAVAYLDGNKPSLVMCRGYYTRAVLAAWDFNGTSLTQRWVFDSNTSGNGGYAGQGNHSLTVGDVDNDGRDEIIYGSCAIDDNGTGLYTTGLGHGDAGHLSDMDPDRAGLEYFQPHENYPLAAGAELRDARTGALIWGYPSTNDVGRGLAANIDGNHRGYEMWASNTDGVYNVNGTRISTTRPSINFRIYWDGDLLDELLDGTKLDKWTGNGVTRLFTFYNYNSAAENNGTKANPGLTADILGDWREEVIYRNSNNDQLMIFTTVTTTNYRFHTLMHDYQYRLAVAWQNVAYNQPPHLSFYLQDGWAAQPVKSITYPGQPLGTPTRTWTVTPTFTRTPTATPLPANYKEIQLEYPCSMDGIFENTNTGYTGDGYANLNNVTGSALTFSLNASSAQSVSLSFVYANGSVNNRNMSISVNGSVQVSSIDFLNTGGWTVWNTSSASVNLAAGYNTITLTSLMAEGAPNLDKVYFVSSAVNDGGCSAVTATRTVTSTSTSPVLPTSTRTATRTVTPTSPVIPTATFTATAGGTTVPSYDGFAAFYGTTGGAGGPSVTANTLQELIDYTLDDNPRVIYINGEINSGDDKGRSVRVGSNKSLIGCGANAFFNGIGLNISNKTNIIVRNIKFTLTSITNTTDPAVYDPDGDEGRPQIIVNGGDCISIQNTSSKIWIDHCEFYQQDPAVQSNQDLYDGLIDIKNNSQYITISWNYFRDHHKCHLVGSSDTDNYDRKITFHHNYYRNIKERMPSYRFGTGHIYSNYFFNVLSSAVNSRMEACLRVENNYFENTDDPILTANSTLNGYWDLRNSSGGADNSNIYQNCTGNRPVTSNCAFNPPYVHLSYMTAAAQVKTEVMAGAGVGKVDLCGGATATRTVTQPIVQSPSFTATRTATATNTQPIVQSPSFTATATRTLTNTPTNTITPLPANYKELQGEAMCSYDGAFEDLHGGYTGTGYANFDNNSGTSGVFYLNALSGQSLNLTFRYANASVNERDMSISVNGTQQPAIIAFPPTGAWTSWVESAVTVNLSAGRNEIVITALTSEGGPNLDLISFASSSVSFDACVPSPTNTPVLTATMTETPEATATITATSSQVAADSPTATVTGTFTVTNTPTLYSLTPSFTPTSTNTMIVTPSNTPQGTITNSPTNSASATASPTPTATAENSATSTATTTVTAGSSGTPTVTMAASPSSSWTATATLTPYPATPTYTATPTLTTVPSNTSTATPSRTATQTSTASRTFTLTATRTTVPVTFTVTPTYTLTPVPDGTVLKITKTDTHPNPVKVSSGDGMTVGFYTTKRCVKASFTMYTRAFRKIALVDKQGPLSAGYNTITIDNELLKNLSPGVYYGIVAATGEDGKETRSKAVTILIIR